VKKPQRKPQGARRKPILVRQTKREQELQGDLDGCRSRLDHLKHRHREAMLIKDATIARQRDWIVVLERRLMAALNEAAELRGDDEDVT
jgi:hypothetical protein